MRQIWRVSTGILLLLVAGFCVFGFLASFEPGATLAPFFKAVYGVVGTACLITAGWLFIRR